MSLDVLKVATYNVNSIRARLGLVLDYLHRETPDVLCLQETKAQDSDFPAGAFHDAGYHVVFRGQKAHAGVAIATREEPHEISFGLDDDGNPDEARLIRLTVKGIRVVNTYVPQGRSADSEHFAYKLEWLSRMRALFERHYTREGPLLWMGDFNVAPEPIDVYDPKRQQNHVNFHLQARAALEQVREWGFVDVFRRHHAGEPEHYTVWDYRARDAVERGIGWRVDHIWATESLARKSARSIIEVATRLAQRPSDHALLMAEFSAE